TATTELYTLSLHDALPICGAKEPTGELASAINEAFGSFEAFKDAFSKAAAGRFGSGWAWLVVTKDGKLAVTSTPNQDTPVMDGRSEEHTSELQSRENLVCR